MWVVEVAVLGSAWALPGAARTSWTQAGHSPKRKLPLGVAGGEILKHHDRQDMEMICKEQNMTKMYMKFLDMWACLQ